jgi:hypothetical protein
MERVFMLELVRQQSLVDEQSAPHLSNELVTRRHQNYRQAIDSLISVLKSGDMDADYRVIHFGEHETLGHSTKITSYRSQVQQYASMLVLRNDTPVLDVWDNGATWDISRYESTGKRTLLDFSPHNLIRECFSSKVADFARSLKGAT